MNDKKHQRPAAVLQCFRARAILMVALFGASLLGRGHSALAADKASHSQLDRIRELERQTVAVIAKAKKSFCFIGGGSGFCISSDGWVLTNHHVVGNQKRMQVFFTGGRMYSGKVVGIDPYGDVALLKLDDAKDLPFLELADSDKARTGQRAIALGDPFLIGSENLFLHRVPPDYEPSASMGIISAVHRYSDSYSDSIQVDMAVNKGNSGGPLIDFEGRVLGINGKIETRFALGINTGVGYAIPANQIKRFLDPLKKADGGRVRHGVIRGLKVAERANAAVGLPIVAVETESLAARAGFRSGDILLSVGGLAPRTRTRYQGIISTYPAGEELEVEVLRGENRKVLTAVLVPPGRAFLGVSTKQTEGDVEGAEVARVVSQSPAKRAGMRVGDVIIAVNDKPVASTTDLAKLIRELSAGDPIKLKFRRGDDEKEVEMRLDAR